MHKSQGFGAPRAREPNPETFRLLAGTPMKSSILDGVDLGWAHVAPKLTAILTRAHNEYDARHPDKIVPVLAQAHAVLARLEKPAWLEAKRVELVETLLACAGVHLEANATAFQVVPGHSLRVTVSALNRSAAVVAVRGQAGAASHPLKRGVPYVESRDLAVPMTQAVTNPYWLESPPTTGHFTVADADLIGLAERPSPFAIDFDLSIAGEQVTARRAAYYTWVDPVVGERYRSVEVTPAVSVTPLVSSLLFSDDKPRELRVRTKSTLEHTEAKVRLQLPAGFRASPESQTIKVEGAGAESEVVFTVHPPKSPQGGTLQIIVDVNGAASGFALSRLEYPHIPIQTRFPPAEVKVVRFELSHARNRIGYVPGAGDDVPVALRQVGYDVTMLDEDTLAHGNLARFDAIVTGVRAFNVNPRLPFVHERLMSYVSAGGTLLVQYNTANRLSKVPPEIGPYPFQISQDRVTDENASVTIAPTATIDRPNRITSADFAGWVQERGLYFASTWDPRYETPLTMNDVGEPAKKGSVLVARVGKGAFVYTGLAFFRQLPAGVPGAFRLFANLLDLGK